MAWGIGWQRRLLAEGRPALARVTGSKRVVAGHGGHHHVQYEFRILSGAKRAGACDVRRNPPSPGATLVILYDSDEPRRQARYPLSLVRLV